MFRNSISGKDFQDNIRLKHGFTTTARVPPIALNSPSQMNSSRFLIDYTNTKIM
jgi:hypothetical protein